MTWDDRARAIGIDPDDPKYNDRHPSWSGIACDWCHRHPETHHRLACDVQRAEGEALAAEGKPHEPCFMCREPRCETRGTICEECRIRTTDSRRRRRPNWQAVRADDTLGDCERIHPTELALMARDGGFQE
jgi:hypothetical protein